MSLLKSLFTNCANPKGRMGQFMLKFMNKCHAPLTNWGLGFVDFQDGWTMLDIGCGGGATLQRLLKRSKGGKAYGIDFAIIVEDVDANSKWTNVVEGMTVYPPEQLKQFLDGAGFTQTTVHLRRPSYATVLGMKP